MASRELTLQVGELALTAQVTGFLDEIAGLGDVGTGDLGVAFLEVEAGVFEVDVGQVEVHVAAFGDFLGFF